MVDTTPGRWGLFSGWSGRFRPEIGIIEKVTPKRIVAKIAGNHRHFSVSDLMASFSTIEDAQKARNSIDGIRGERERRLNAAHEAANHALDALLEKING